MESHPKAALSRTRTAIFMEPPKKAEKIIWASSSRSPPRKGQPNDTSTVPFVRFLQPTIEVTYVGQIALSQALDSTRLPVPACDAGAGDGSGLPASDAESARHGEHPSSHYADRK